MRLFPVDEAWENAWKRLMSDPWLVRKLNRERCVKEHWAYLDEWFPEIYSPPLGFVIDVGCGGGFLLELARSIGHVALGIDAPSGEGGMGNNYLAACRLLHQRQRLSVTYIGLQEWLAWPHDDMKEQVALVNSRGSIEQAFCDCLVGDPHHLHHNCKRLAWKTTDKTSQKFQGMFRVFGELLRADGLVVIAANGTLDTDEWYDREIRRAAERTGLKLLKQEGFLNHKWGKA